MPKKSFSILVMLAFVLSLSTSFINAQDSVLRYAGQIDFATFDPHSDQRNVLVQLYQYTFEGLTGEDPNGAIIPMLAESWDYSEDLSTLTFNLRQDVTFHDGTPFNADAVTANFDHVKNGDFVATANFFSSVDSVEAVDEYTSQWNLNSFDATLLLNVARFAGYQISPAVIEAGTEDSTLIGTGPWVYQEGQSEQGSIYIYERYENHWDPEAAQIQRIEHIILADTNARLNGLLVGQVDVADIGTPASLASLEQQGYQTLLKGGIVWGLTIFDLNGAVVPELADVRVRRAMAHAINSAGFDGVTDVGVQSKQRYSEGQYAHDENFDDLAYDLDAARALMEEAGVEGFSFSVPAFGQFIQRSELLAGMFAEIGIEMSVEAIPPGTIFAECRSGNWVAAICPLNKPHPKTFIEDRILSTGFLAPAAFSDEAWLGSDAGAPYAEIVGLYEEAAGLSNADAEPLWKQALSMVASEAYILYFFDSCPGCASAAPYVENITGRFNLPAVVTVRGVTVNR